MTWSRSASPAYVSPESRTMSLMPFVHEFGAQLGQIADLIGLDRNRTIELFGQSGDTRQDWPPWRRKSAVCLLPTSARAAFRAIHVVAHQESERRQRQKPSWRCLANRAGSPPSFTATRSAFRVRPTRSYLKFLKGFELGRHCCVVFGRGNEASQRGWIVKGLFVSIKNRLAACLQRAVTCADLDRSDRRSGG